ncbi:hypothetical protein [Mitsuaria sp. GD03876]|uniref:hypothetical protein n=1 Tax=Mitsuaria sp. GD03876 TaxID=2975399 RepID=UPI00244B5B76|nr:hypothetical protein [Mitsuaria sp. GD03876]MDH0866108.1 hypothetical protein [Mitsuaria sp. GD03876]
MLKMTAEPLLVSFEDDDGWEYVIDPRAKGELSQEQRTFINCVEARDRALGPTAFSRIFGAESLMDACGVESEPDRARDQLTVRGLELLVARRPARMQAALRVRDAADAFLTTSTSPRETPRQAAATMRLAAGLTLQEELGGPLRALKAADRDRLDARAPVRAMALREHARMLARFFGVHRSAALGIDFILDANGRVAYAFKAMTARAPRALCGSHTQRAVEAALCPGPRAPAPQIVAMPGRWCAGTGDATRPALFGAEEPSETLGLLMPAPAGFDLCLPSGNPDGEVARDLIVARHNGRLAPEAMDRLLLVKLLCGGADLTPPEVLVDVNGKPWLLDPERLLASDEEARSLAAARRFPDPDDAGQGDTEPGASETFEPMPMRTDALQTLADLDLEKRQRALASRCQPTAREKFLLSEALGHTAVDDVAASASLWPGAGAQARALRLAGEIAAWAREAIQHKDRLLNEPLDGIEAIDAFEDMRRFADMRSSVAWLLETIPLAPPVEEPPLP